MSIDEIIHKLNLTLLTTPKDFSGIHPTGGYCSDLLSCVMAGAKSGDLWITLQAHLNIVAVAALTDCSAIIITEGASPDPEVVARANSQGVTLLSTTANNYEVVGKLWSLGIQ